MLDIAALRDLRERSVNGRFYAMFHEYDDRVLPGGHNGGEPMDPTPVHPVHGPSLCPPIDIIEIIDDGNIHVHHGTIHAGAAWESPLHPDNVHALALAEYIVALINAAPELTRSYGARSQEGA
jgi:hypothetical protein